MGYDINYIEERWGQPGRHLGNIHGDFIRIWCTDNNGEIADANNNRNNTIGRLALRNQIEKGNEGNLIKHAWG